MCKGLCARVALAQPPRSCRPALPWRKFSRHRCPEGAFLRVAISRSRTQVVGHDQVPALFPARLLHRRPGRKPRRYQQPTDEQER